ncbi:uncharacterized protein LOC110456170 [Mizuhopecten yessoensis]|uniref:EF-hand domain-containing protein n=1 Tax=Mizuhopecten yessoensis TaxID=6573 RepID=A0A210QBM5_MIZYE|nr:uncharacterized protein LOC110456170 [Mizuhopecten yessoensis]OWF46131.1 hypothetical protein KP79_PYT04328 [Mizuhopecten yessoensis]
MLLQLLIVFVGCTTVFAQSFTHNDIMGAVDATFHRRDLNGDSILELYELINVYDSLDTNKDDRVSESEYEQRGTDMFHRFLGIVFQQLDTDGDGFLDKGAEYGQYTMMDTNFDNQVSRREYDAFFTKVVEDAIKNYGHLLGPDLGSFTTSSPGGNGGAPVST